MFNRMSNLERMLARGIIHMNDGTGDGGGSGEGAGEGAGEGEGQSGAGEQNKDLEALQAQMTTISEENKRLQAKIDEANKHKRNAEKEAAQKAREKAEADGNYQQLFESSEKERTTLQEQLAEMVKTTEREKIGTAAMDIASSIADGDNVGILAEFIKPRLKFVENSIKITDSDGNLTVSTLDDLKKEFSGSARFSSLIRGNQSSGGSATGGSKSGGAVSSITRTEFESMSMAQRTAYAKTGGKITD
jgi:hypothetical protein